MNQPPESISVEELTEYSFEAASKIGKLLPHLSEKFSSQPIPEQLLQNIVSSKSHAQLVAKTETGEIVGLATVTLTLGVGAGRGAWLEDFVVDPNVRGAGIGSKLWQAVIDWCRQNQVEKLGFTSRPTREAAHKFYLSRGAKIRDTAYFRKIID